jgi:hypothetical protein
MIFSKFIQSNDNKYILNALLPFHRRPDPNGILAFLISSLQAAEDAGQRVWIIGHMPPGGPDALRDQVRDVFDVGSVVSEDGDGLLSRRDRVIITIRSFRGIRIRSRLRSLDIVIT